MNNKELEDLRFEYRELCQQIDDEQFKTFVEKSINQNGVINKVFLKEFLESYSLEKRMEKLGK
jgi:hypothetical protein